MEKLKQALKMLGVQGIVTTKQRDKWTVDIYVNGVWLGLWDKTKNTFVS